MNTYDFKQGLMEELLTLPAAKRTKDGVVVRCPSCGDSRKSKDHGHLHIRINLRNDEPIIYHCFRCDDFKGIFNSSTLRELELYDNSLSSTLIQYNNSSIRKIKKSLRLKNNKLDIKNPNVKDINLAEPKRKYLNERLGVDLSIEQWCELKVVFNLIELLMANNLKEFTSSKDTILALHANYVGFLTTANEFVNCRCIYPEGQRYYKYTLKEIIGDTKKMYIIPSAVDLLSTEKVTINIAEGVFDILGIYLNLTENHENQIYSAVCGCGFQTVVTYFIQSGLFGDNIRINIYSDKDKDRQFYDKLFNQISPYVGEIYLYYNEKGKDYGVPKEEISLLETRIK